MDFSEPYLLTRQNVQDQAPAAAGLYRLSTASLIFYVGRSRNLRRRLYEHLGNKRTSRIVTWYRRHQPCFFSFALIEPGADLLKAERDEIHRHDPRANIDIQTIVERQRQTVLSLKTGPVTLHTYNPFAGRRSQANRLLAEIACAIAKRPAGHCDRWAVGVFRGRVVCFPYAKRDRLRPVLLCLKERYANNGFSPATWELIRKRITEYLPAKSNADQGTTPILVEGDYNVTAT